MSAELAPCPFCGPGRSIVSLWHDDMAQRWRVGCGRCGCSTGTSPRDKTEAPAIAAWNRRTPPAPMEAAPFMYAYECVDDGQWQAYRQQLRRADGSICPGRPLYTHPPQPDALPGGLREKMIRAIWTQLPQEDANMGISGRIADAILSLIQSERGGG